MSYSFFLFDLPFVAVREVFSMMSPFELIEMSKVSCQLKKVVTFHSRVLPYNLEIRIKENLAILLHSTSGTIYRYKFTADWTQDGMIKTYYIRKTWDCIFEKSISAEDLLETQRDHFQYLKSVLNLNLDRIEFDMQQFGWRNRDTTNWLKEEFPEIPIIYLDGKDFVPPEDVQYLLDQLHITKKIILHSKVTGEVAIRIPKIWEYLEIRRQSWMKLEHFLELDCFNIRLANPTLSNRDLNSFFKKWIKMECHRGLGVFTTMIRRADDLEAILEGIDHKESDASKPQKLDFERADGQGFVSIADGRDITRIDGTVATVGVFRCGACIIIHMTV